MNRIKLMAVSFAAYDAGHTELPYPVVHSLVYYLSHGSLQLSFPGYIFSMAIHPKFGDFDQDITYPASVELSDDLDRLTSEGLLRKERGSTRFLVGREGRDQKPNILQAFAQVVEEVTYERLVEETRGALADYRSLITQCYNLYLRL